jgi:hypothetical protein
VRNATKPTGLAVTVKSGVANYKPKSGRRQNWESARVRNGISPQLNYDGACRWAGPTSDARVELEPTGSVFPSIQTPVIADPCRKPKSFDKFVLSTNCRGSRP